MNTIGGFLYAYSKYREKSRSSQTLPKYVQDQNLNNVLPPDAKALLGTNVKNIDVLLANSFKGGKGLLSNSDNGFFNNCDNVQHTNTITQNNSDHEIDDVWDDRTELTNSVRDVNVTDNRGVIQDNGVRNSIFGDGVINSMPNNGARDFSRSSGVSNSISRTNQNTSQSGDQLMDVRIT